MTARRHRTDPELTCESCQTLSQELEAKTEIIHKLSMNNTELAEELSGARTSLGVAGKAINSLENHIRRQAKQSARSEQIEQVIAHWKKHRPKTKASGFPPGGKNWTMIEKAIGLMAEDEDGPVKACQEAIDGLHLAPYWSYGDRFAADGPGRKLKNRLEHALGDENRILQCREILHHAKGLPLDAKYRAADLANGIAREWDRVLLDALQEGARNSEGDSNGHANGNGHHPLGPEKGDGRMNETEVPGGPVPEDAALFDPGHLNGREAGGGGDISPPEDALGVAEARTGGTLEKP